MKYGRMITDGSGCGWADELSVCSDGKYVDHESAENHLARPSERMNRNQSESGYSILQLLITVAIIAVVVTFAFVGITSARANIRLSNSVRTFAGYAERARADAVRRHDATSLQQVSATTYSITMDFNGSGTGSAQTFSTEKRVSVYFSRTVVF